MSFIDMLEAEVQRIEGDIPTDEELKNISELANRQLYLESLMARLEKAQELVKEHHVKVSERYLPDALASAGVTAFTLDDGRKVSVKKVYLPSVLDENKESAYEWMVENGHDIIKNEVVVGFTKGQSEEATELIRSIREIGYEPSRKETIHWQTFRAWAKEQMELGTELPETINIYVKNISSVK